MTGLSDDVHRTLGTAHLPCRSLVERAVAELGRFDIPVNNASLQMTREGIEQILDGEWEHAVQANVYRPR